MVTWAVTGALLGVPLALAPTGPASADVTSLPGTMSTATQSTSSFTVHVPPGVTPQAVTAVLTMPEVVAGGVVTFAVNGAPRTQVDSALYQKVRIPVTPADVIADGTIALSFTSTGPAAAGASCVPAQGTASVRKIELDYAGAETPPTSAADFFPESTPVITVVIPPDSTDDVITAGLTAVTALSYRYGESGNVALSTAPPDPSTLTAGSRVVAIGPGQGDGVTTAISADSGVPVLGIAGTGEDLVNAAATLSSDTFGLSGSDAANPSLQSKPRDTATTRTLDDLGVGSLTITGYGTVAQEFELRQDSFGVPVDSVQLRLQGSHTAFPASSGARLDVRANGSLIGSTTLGDDTTTFSLDARIPAGSIRSVNDIQLVLSSTAPDGSACQPASVPPAELDVDMTASTVKVSHGTGQTRGFQLYPQVFEGTVPVALRADEGRRSTAAINAAALLASLQRAAASPLRVQLMDADAFIADDRSGIIVGARAADSEALDAPLKLSSTRLLDRTDAVEEITSQDPYAVLESIDRNERLVLMLGSWAPGDIAAPGALARKVVDAVVNAGWADLDGDLVIADEARPAFVTASRSFTPEPEVEEEKSYARWFVLVIGVLLLLLALQVVVAIRRDRRLSREEPETDDEYAEPEAYEVDALGDVDDLEVHDGLEPREGESQGYDEEYAEDEWAEDADDAEDAEDAEDWDGEDLSEEDEDDDWGVWGEESDEIGPDDQAAEPEAVEDPEPEPEPESESVEEPVEEEPEPPRRRWTDNLREGTVPETPKPAQPAVPPVTPPVTPTASPDEPRSSRRTRRRNRNRGGEGQQ